MKQCRFEYGGYRCKEVEVVHSLCAFHDPSLDKDATKIQERLEERIQETANDKTLILDGSIFTGGVSFHKMVFSCSVSFSLAEFHGKKTNFSAAEFRGVSTNFSLAQFHAELTDFEEAKFFSKATYFYRAQFHGTTTRFTFAEFHSEATHFIEAAFSARVTNFLGVRFYGETTYFGLSELNGIISFILSEFHSKTTDFSSVRISGTVSFYNNLPDSISNKCLLSFRNIVVNEKGYLIFDGVNLSKTELLAADLARVKFLDVKWNHAARSWAGRWRSRPYDEALWRERRQKAKLADSRERRQKEANDADLVYLAELARLSRQLKAYYRQTGEYQLVGHFHYGLMEMQWHQRELEHQPQADVSHRRRLWLWLKRKSRKWISWEAAYRYSSGYGESYVRSASVLGLVILVFTGVYWWLGVPAPPRMEVLPWFSIGPFTAEGLPYISPGDLSGLHQTSFWKHGLAALAYSLQTASLGRLVYFKDSFPQSPLAEIAYTFESILGPVQIAFFVVALRNRFRR
jgi:uncharacterized protein YjbI with pentapeptide repeats